MIRKQIKCYIYTRVSTAIQVDGYSLDAQREKLKKYAEFQEYEIVGEYCDGGFSGKNTKDRPGFQRMMKDIQDNKDGVSFVLVFKPCPIYMGKIAYGRRKTEKKIGTRNEMHIVA